MVKTWSAGGLGDAFIVGCKLNQYYYTDICKTGSPLNHLFVESNPKTCELIQEYINYFWDSKNFQFEVECDPNYQESYFQGKWKDRSPINTSVNGEYHFPGPDGIVLNETFANIHKLARTPKEKKFDVCIQVAGGVNSNRGWKFDPDVLATILNVKGYQAALVGTAKEFESNESYNFVNKTSLGGTLDIVRSSKIYCGVSGFLTYTSLAFGIKNLHLEESPEHNKHYIHDSWNKDRYGLKYGSLQEVIGGLRHWGIEL